MQAEAVCVALFYVINKIPFNVVLKIKKEAVWQRIHKLVRAKLEALEKLWFVRLFSPLCARWWLSCDRANMTLSETCVSSLNTCHVHIQWLSDVTLKNS